MGLGSVFTKTAKGLDEISTHQNRLPARVRAMLIMVDGKRTGDEFLGPDADTFTVTIEKAKSAEELLQHPGKLREVMLAAAGKKKSDDFWEKISLALA